MLTLGDGVYDVWGLILGISLTEHSAPLLRLARAPQVGDGTGVSSTMATGQVGVEPHHSALHLSTRSTHPA